MESIHTKPVYGLPKRIYILSSLLGFINIFKIKQLQIQKTQEFEELRVTYWATVYMSDLVCI